MSKESWNQYQNDYNRTHYTQLSTQLDQQLVKEFKEQLKKDNISFSSFMRKIIKEYLGK